MMGGRPRPTLLFDDVLRMVGEFGPYQIVLYILYGIVGFPAGRLFAHPPNVIVRDGISSQQQEPRKVPQRIDLILNLSDLVKNVLQFLLTSAHDHMESISISRHIYHRTVYHGRCGSERKSDPTHQTVTLFL